MLCSASKGHAKTNASEADLGVVVVYPGDLHRLRPIGGLVLVLE